MAARKNKGDNQEMDAKVETDINQEDDAKPQAKVHDDESIQE